LIIEQVTAENEINFITIISYTDSHGQKHTIIYNRLFDVSKAISGIGDGITILCRKVTQHNFRLEKKPEGCKKDRILLVMFHVLREIHKAYRSNLFFSSCTRYLITGSKTRN
jgi:hypothetical protein